MALRDIIALIGTEADEKAASVLEKAKEEVKTLQEKSKESTAKTVDLLKKEGEMDRAAMEKRVASLSLRDERIILSVAQKEMVDATFTGVEKSLQSLSGDDLTAVFTTLASQVSAEKGEVKVLGKGKIEMEKALSSLGKSFTVSEDTSSSLGGFLFKGDGFEMDFSFSTVVEKDLRPSQEAKVFKELF